MNLLIMFLLFVQKYTSVFTLNLNKIQKLALYIQLNFIYMLYLRYLFIVISLAIFGCKSEYIETKDENGNVIERYQVNTENQKDGLLTIYSTDGVIGETANYKNGKLSGVRKIFYADGNLEIEENYQNDIADGPYKVYHPNGKVNFEANYANGVLQGITKTYNDKGQLKEEVTFSNNDENGPFKEYYDNGQLEWEGTYLNGDNEFGLLKKYDDSGELVKKMMCDSMAICRTIWTKADGDITPKF